MSSGDGAKAFGDRLQLLTRCATLTLVLAVGRAAADIGTAEPPSLEPVENTAALASLPSRAARVFRKGFAIAGDGGAASYLLGSQPCTLGAGAGDGGSQVRLLRGGCANIDWTSVGGEASPQLFEGAPKSRNDTAALSAAISSGRPVRLRAGSYTSSTIHLTARHSGLAIRLDPGAVIMLAGNVNGSLFYVDGANGVTIDGGTMDGNAPQQSSGRGLALIDVVKSDSFTLRNARIQASFGPGLRIIGSRSTVQDNIFSDTGYTSIYVVSALPDNSLTDTRIYDNFIDRSRIAPEQIIGGCISIQAQASSNSSPNVIRNTCRLPSPSKSMADSPSRGNPPFFSVIGIEVTAFLKVEPRGMNIVGGYPIANALIAENQVSGGGEAYSLCGLVDSVVANNISTGSLFTGIELAADRDILLSANMIRLDDQSNGNAVWVTGSRRVTASATSIIGGGRGGIAYNFFYSTGSILGGSITIRGSSKKSTAIFQSSNDRMDERGMAVIGVTVKGYTGYGMQFINPYLVRVADNFVGGSSISSFLYTAVGSQAGRYIFTSNNNIVDPVEGGVPYLKSFSAASRLAGSYILSTTQISGGAPLDWRSDR